MLRFLLIAFLIYLAYRFIFHFVIPVYQASSRIKKGFKEMNEKMRAQQQGQYQNNHTSPEPEKKASSRPDPKDYIEFEEVK